MHAASVCNAGYPGENSSQILQHLSQALDSCQNASVVVVLVGMNDAANGKRLLTPSQTRANVTQLLTAVRAAGAIPLLVTVHQPDTARLMTRHQASEYGMRTPAQRVDDVNIALRSAAAKTRTHVVDFAAYLAKAGGATLSMSTDGVHLTAAGYNLLAKAVASNMPELKPNAKVLCLGDSLTYGIGVREPSAPDVGSGSYPQQLEPLLR